MWAACGDRDSDQATVVEERLSLCQQLLYEVGGLERKGVCGAYKLMKLLDSEHSFLRSVSRLVISRLLMKRAKNVHHSALRLTSCYRVKGRPLRTTTCQAPTSRM